MTDNQNRNRQSITRRFLADVPMEGISAALQNLLVDMKSRIEALYVDPSPPAQPTGVTAIKGAVGTLVSWNRTLKAVRYQAFRNTTSDIATATILRELSGNGNTNFFDPQSLSIDVGTRYFWIRALNAIGTPGPFSRMASYVENGQLLIGLESHSLSIAAGESTVVIRAAAGVNIITSSGAASVLSLGFDSVSTPTKATIGSNRIAGGTYLPLTFDTGGVYRVAITSTGSVVLNLSGSAVGTTANDGFTYIPTCAGAPTGVPTSFTGAAATIYDSTNLRLYIYTTASGWKSVLLA